MKYLLIFSSLQVWKQPKANSFPRLLQAADCPADLKFEYPSKIIKYKDKYLCFIELDEAPMSAKEMIEASSYSGNLVVEYCIYGWNH